MTDPQQDDTPPDIEDFRNELAAVFRNIEFDISEISPGYLYANLDRREVVTITRRDLKLVDRKGPPFKVSTYEVQIGTAEASSNSLPAAVTRVRNAISDTVVALEAVGLEIC
jgi:hypothetical protein